ncbi:hypothetical protein MNBD_GAMMA11-1684 [hydrothermal vent metagenome]|uniref:Uncharacterized protein n=1 Tax=hydrothermal vent metagenome TaxID=652676 RepID=A0A3B0XD33_9ZZZZ
MSAIKKLTDLVGRLYVETEGYADNPSDAQLWYNRGYANGIAAYFFKNNFADKLNHLTLDAPDVYKNEKIMQWHKAYHHGFEMGERESGEVCLVKK